MTQLTLRKEISLEDYTAHIVKRLNLFDVPVAEMQATIVDHHAQLSHFDTVIDAQINKHGKTCKQEQYREMVLKRAGIFDREEGCRLGYDHSVELVEQAIETGFANRWEVTDVAQRIADFLKARRAMLRKPRKGRK